MFSFCNASTLVAILRWVSKDALGEPVVPEVHDNSAGSSGAGVGRSSYVSGLGQRQPPRCSRPVVHTFVYQNHPGSTQDFAVLFQVTRRREDQTC